jgi:SAM-dependent methyltransferase
MAYMYDAQEDHWQECVLQVQALFRLDYDKNWKPRYDNVMYPYTNLDNAGLGQRANAAMFNVAKELIGKRMNTDGYALDVGAYNGWASFRLAESKKTVALDSSDHACYGVGSVPSTGKGIEKVVGDGCYLPFPENTFDIVFMASALHHMHDKVRAMNEAHRVLRRDGIFVAIGDKMMDDSEIDKINLDGIRDYEGMAYGESTLRGWFAASDFTKLKLLPIKYRKNMEYMSMELIAGQGDNAVIYGIKE